MVSRDSVLFSGLPAMGMWVRMTQTDPTRCSQQVLWRCDQMYLQMLMFHTQVAFPTWGSVGSIYVAILGQALVTDVSSPLGQC